MSRKRRERMAIFQQLINAGYDGGTAGAIANAPNIHKAHNRYRHAMRNAPGPAPAPPPAPTPAPPPPPPAPKPVAAPVQSYSTQAQVGNTVRRPRKAKKKTRLSDLRVSRTRPSINRSLSIGAGGTGLNVGGY